MIDVLAPIVVFVYNRVDKAEKMLTSLSQNALAAQSELFVFSDGPQKENDKDVAAVRAYLDTSNVLNKFAKVTVIKAERNKGLSLSVITGVKKVIDEFNKVIVVEDDNVVASDFLDYMNGALDYYESNQRVWSISGYSHFVPQGYDRDVYAMGRINSYAWATWKRSWDATDWDVSDYSNFRYNLFKRRAFNRFGNDSAMMLDAQMAGMISSWAIRFSYAMFNHGMITIYPCHSKTRNIGEDGSGTHVSRSKTSGIISLDTTKVVFEAVELEDSVIKQFRKAVHRSMPVRLRSYFKLILLNAGKRYH